MIIKKLYFKNYIDIIQLKIIKNKTNNLQGRSKFFKPALVWPSILKPFYVL